MSVDTKRLMQMLLITSVVMLAFLFFTKNNKHEEAAQATQPALIDTATAPRPTTTRAEQVVTLGGLAGDYKLAGYINTRTGGFDLVQLSEYTVSVKDKSPFAILHNDVSGAKPFGTAKITINGTTADLGSWVWELIKAEPGEVILQTEPSETDPNTHKERKIARIQKIFKLAPKSYDVYISHKVENLTDAPMSVAIDQYGPFNIPLDSNRGEDRNYQTAVYNTEKNYVNTSGHLVAQMGLKKEHHADLGNFSADKDPAIWVAAANRFFAVVTRPDGGKTYPIDGGRRQITMPGFFRDAKVALVAPTSENYGILFTGNTLNVPANGSVDMPLNVFMGPKQRALLEGNLKAAPETPAYLYAIYHYFDVIQFSQGGMCGFCTFSWLATAILWVLDAIYKYALGGWVYGYGVAIMILVILMRLALHPLTRYSQVSMAKMQKKMAAIKPEIDRVKKKYEKDTAKQQQETMRIYKENNVNPAGGIAGCLPMMLQMPIWIALYAGLQIDIDLRHAAFIPGWINDLANPDTIIAVSDPAGLNIPILSMLLGPIHGLNLLPILLGVVFFVQMRISMASMPQSADPQQAQTQKMSQYMILLFPLFLYGSPSGLNVYIFASTIGGIFDTWLVRKHLRKEGLLPAANPTGPMM